MVETVHFGLISVFVSGFVVSAYTALVLPAIRRTALRSLAIFLFLLFVIMIGGEDVAKSIWGHARSFYTTAFIGEVDRKDLERAHGDVFDWSIPHQWHLVTVQEIVSPTIVRVRHTREIRDIDVILIGLRAGSTPPEEEAALKELRRAFPTGQYVSILLPMSVSSFTDRTEDAHGIEDYGIGRKQYGVLFAGGECLNLELLKTGKFFAELFHEIVPRPDVMPESLMGWRRLMKALFFQRAQLYHNIAAGRQYVGE